MTPQNPDQTISVPKGIECPRCKQVIESAMSALHDGKFEFKKGVVIVCSQCALPSIVGDSGLVPLSREQIRGMPQTMQAQLLATCAKIAESATRNN